MKRLSTCGLIALLYLLAGCDSTAPPGAQQLELAFLGVEPAQNGFHYEGWAIIDDQPHSTGKFNVDAQGRIVDLNGQIIPNGRFSTGLALDRASAIVITFEEPGGDAAPSDTKYLAGNVSGDMATLTAGHMAALGNSFAGASGAYILATPTAPDVTDLSGVWFIDPTGTEMAPGLTLPELPMGWIYEGWAVIDGVPLTTGTFRRVDEADMAAPFSGPDPGPPFPGEDFIVNAPAGLAFPTDLSGQKIVVSIEPYPDDDPAPFALKPLAGDVPDPAQPMTLYQMLNERETFPSGTARVF